MRKEIVSLAKDLRTYVEQIQLLPDVKQELDALEESTTGRFIVVSTSDIQSDSLLRKYTIENEHPK